MDLTMYRGDDASWEFTVKVKGVAVTLAGAADVRFTAKARIGDADADAIFVKTLASGVTITDYPGGVLVVQLDRTDTASLTVPRTLLWDLQLRDDFDKVHTIAAGNLKILADVSIATS